MKGDEGKPDSNGIGPAPDHFKEALQTTEAAWDRMHALRTPEMEERIRCVARQLLDIVIASGRYPNMPCDIKRIHESDRKKNFLNLFGLACRIIYDSGDNGQLHYLDIIIGSLRAIADAQGDE